MHLSASEGPVVPQGVGNNVVRDAVGSSYAIGILGTSSSDRLLESSSPSASSTCRSGISWSLDVLIGLSSWHRGTVNQQLLFSGRHIDVEALLARGR